ncbi:MAG TPA: hypothetical protein VJ385_11730 [Fibrobacteria bacterium]|nr:hypothetical protein [Fibrobacteria bacterium]
MSADSKTFHESWHRIAGQRIALRPSVQAHRQLFRGSRWHVLRDPFANQFYRLSAPAWRFVARLSPRRTVEEAWKEALAADPDTAPGQGDVVELLAQLYHANLLHSDLPPDSVKLFERQERKKQRVLKANLANIMFFRVPLLDPDRLLQALMPLIRLLFSPLGGAVWLAAVAYGTKVAVDNFAALKVQSQAVLAPGNLFLLYAGLVLVKVLHEFGHAAAVRRFGGEVHVMGVMFLIFNPVPYMDATSAWAFRSKWKRILVGAAGMVVEVFVATIAVVVWAHTGPGAMHSLAYNMIFIASVSTLVFNLNPLLRFDGYYMLSDWLDMPNLHQQARGHLIYLIERYLFGAPDAETPARDRKEGWLLACFGAASLVYRFAVFGAILLFVADRFLILGILMAVICAVSWVLLPLAGAAKYLGSSPRLAKVRGRAWTVSGGALTALILGTAVVPFPDHFKAPGVVRAARHVLAVNRTEGTVDSLLAEPGRRVAAGAPLVSLRNPELDIQIRETEMGLAEAEAMLQASLGNRHTDLKAAQSRLDYFARRLERLRLDRDSLLVRAPITGIWVSPRGREWRGRWIPKGTPLGQIVDDSAFQFVSVVSQQDASDLFAGQALRAQVKIAGRAGGSIAVHGYQSIPMDQSELPSAALGWAAGGDIPVDRGPEGAARTTEPFYEVRAELTAAMAGGLLHGRSGTIRFTLPDRPPALQAYSRFRQLIQKRYQL